MNSDVINSNSHNDRKLIPVTKWNDHHAWPPIGGLRYLIFNADSNGFSHCIRRVGRKVLIDESRFFEWVDSRDKEQSESVSLASRA